MQSVMQVFWEIVLAITGAVALSALSVFLGVFALGCASVGCAWSWRRWRRNVQARRTGED